MGEFPLRVKFDTVDDDGLMGCEAGEGETCPTVSMYR